MKLDTNQHSVFSLNYHLILVIKYRRKVLDDNVSLRAKEIFDYISPRYNITSLEWKCEKECLKKADFNKGINIAKIN